MPTAAPRLARILPVLGLLVLAGGLACGGSNSSGPPRSGLKVVLVVNNEFQPATANISAGDTVQWSWTSGSIGHNIISTGSPSFTSKGTANGTTVNTDIFNFPASYQFIFTAAGTYDYYCSTHGTTSGSGNTGMAGTVVVAP